MAGAIDCKFDGTFTEEPHLGVEMTMRRMRISIRGQSCGMYFDKFACCQFSFQDLSHLRVIEVLYSHAFKWKGCRGQRIVLGSERGNCVSISAGMSLQTSRLVNDILTSSEKFAGALRSFSLSLQMSLINNAIRRPNAGRFLFRKISNVV
jgi:hypothetical protein